MEDDQFAVLTFSLFANLLLTHNVRLTNGVGRRWERCDPRSRRLGLKGPL